MASPFLREFYARILTKAAATATRDDAVVRAPFAGTVSAVTFVADTILSGADTDSATLSLINKGAAGAGTTVVASKAFASGVDAAAMDETAITLSATAADLVVAAGDILALSVIKVGSSGLAVPPGLLKVVLTAST